nr:MAG TPA: hypothetical protein [Caudoviricetes sp.]
MVKLVVEVQAVQMDEALHLLHLVVTQQVAMRLVFLA